MSGGHGIPPSPVAYSVLPGEIQLFCPVCKKDQRWQCSESRVFQARSYTTVHYKCRNCGKAIVTYFVSWRETETAGVFEKVGQDPPLTVLPSADLRLGAEDLDLYKKALTSRNHAYGLGALSYLRRVVENQMNALLDLVVEAARASGVTGDHLAGLDEVRKSGTFEDKAKFAASILPAHLRPGGHNPVDVICSFASEGLHSRSEDECLAIFDEVRLVFEYLFRHLTFETGEARSFARSLTQLASKKPPRR